MNNHSSSIAAHLLSLMYRWTKTASGVHSSESERVDVLCYGAGTDQPLSAERSEVQPLDEAGRRKARARRSHQSLDHASSSLFVCA